MGSTARQVRIGSSPSATSRIHRNFRLASYCLIALSAFLLIFLPSTVAPSVALLTAAFMFGWAEVEGACGRSHVLAITPLRLLDPSGMLWLKSSAAYTVGGLATAGPVGGMIGLLGMLAYNLQSTFLPVSAVLASALATRELGLVHFSLPQLYRQTNRMWALQFGFVPGAAMWGAHIGLGFATVISHGGIYVLSVLSLALGPAWGVCLFTMFWIGRTAPIWLTPLLTNSRQGDDLHDAVLDGLSSYRFVHVAALLYIVGAILYLRLIPEDGPFFTKVYM